MKTIFFIIILGTASWLCAQYSGGSGRGDVSVSLYNTHLPVIKAGLEIPLKSALYPNYPNPFNPVTKIRFELSQTENRKQKSVTRLIIYDISGKEVQTLVNEVLSPGVYEVDFNGSEISSGIYFYKLTAGEFSETGKMILMK